MPGHGTESETRSEDITLSTWLFRVAHYSTPRLSYLCFDDYVGSSSPGEAEMRVLSSLVIVI